MNILDPVVNFGLVTVSTGYDASATSIQLVASEAAKLPDPAVDGEYNLTWWDSTTYGNPSQDPNKEIVRVTGVAVDVLTVVRAQEGTSASTKNTGANTYMMSLGVTKKTIDDLLPHLGLPIANDAVATYTTNDEIDTITTGGETYTFNRNSSRELDTVTFGSNTLTVNRDSQGRVISFTLS